MSRTQIPTHVTEQMTKASSKNGYTDAAKPTIIIPNNTSVQLIMVLLFV